MQWWTLLHPASFVLNIVVCCHLQSTLWILIVGCIPSTHLPPATLMKSSPVALYTSIYLLPMWCLCLRRAISRWETFSNSTKASPFLLPCGDKQRATPGMGKFQWGKTKNNPRQLSIMKSFYVLFGVLYGHIWWVLRWVFMVGFYGGTLNWVLVLFWHFFPVHTDSLKLSSG